MQSIITYPQLLLLTYHLGDTNIWEQKQQEWQVPDTTPGQNYSPFKPNDLEAFWQRSQINDSEMLFLGCSYPDPDYREQPLASFQKFRAAIETNGNMGRTWMLLGIEGDRQPAHQLELAQNIYQTFTGTNEHPDLATGKFKHANFFYQQDTVTQENIIILLFPDQNSIDLFPDTYNNWLNLCCYQHKITWSYNQARAIKKKLVEDKFFPRAEDFSNLDNLDQLKKDFLRNLALVSQHNIAVESFRIQKNNIDLNLRNYKKYLTRLEQQPETDLTALQDFCDLTKNTFKTQLKVDEKNLDAGLRLRKELLESMRGVVEIYNAESNRRQETQNQLLETRNQRQEERNQTFQNRVGIVGVGAAFAATTVSVVTPYIETPNDPKVDMQIAWKSMAIAGSISLGIGLVASVITWLILRGDRR